MKNTTIFCLTLEPEHEEIIKKLSYIPVGLGKKKFSNECFTDKTGQNISHKNIYIYKYISHYIFIRKLHLHVIRKGLTIQLINQAIH